MEEVRVEEGGEKWEKVMEGAAGGGEEDRKQEEEVRKKWGK